MSCNNPIILGGGGSSGSTLLISILNRNKEIAAGPELSLFNKEYFFTTPFEKVKKQSKRLIDGGITTTGWFLYPGVDFHKYGITQEEVQTLFQESEDQKAFVDAFFGQYLKKEGKNVWAEKTPSNVYCFEHILELYPKARLIHIYRDGRDVITSFIKRGMSPYFATMLWLYNTSIALTYRDHPNYFELKYESLVENPFDEVSELCKFLGVEMQQEMIMPNEDKHLELATWNNSPSREINSSSIGKHKAFLTSYHKYAINHTSISQKHIKKYGLKFTSVKDLQTALGYGSDEEDSNGVSYFTGMKYFIKLLYSQMRDLLWRYYKLSKNREKYTSYPGRIRP